MKDIFLQFVIDLYNDVPTYIYIILLVIFFVGLWLFYERCSYKIGVRYTLRLLLLEYVSLLLFSTVIFRPGQIERKYETTLFWSYYAIDFGNEELIAENVMNVVVFIPVGLLLGCAFGKMTWWKVMIIGMSVSVAVEVMQFVYKRGLAEVDDVIHNTLGCLVGYGLLSIVRYGFERLSKRRVVVL